MIGGAILTPAGPAFQDMRDGILAAAKDRECLVWDAFADYGVGVGASTRLRGNRVVVTESFGRPAGCTELSNP